MSKEAKVSTIRKFMTEGTVSYPLSFYKEREKASGAMYKGKMIVEYKGMTIFFDMWHHHNSETPMTEDEVLENLHMNGLKIGPKYYDIHWYARIFNGKFFLHDTGWFGLTPEARALNDHRLIRLNHLSDDDIEFTAEDEQELISLGFRRIPELDYIKEDDSMNTIGIDPKAISWLIWPEYLGDDAEYAAVTDRKFKTFSEAVKYLAETDLPNGDYSIDLHDDLDNNDCYREGVAVIKTNDQVTLNI